MIKTYQYRLYPTKTQALALEGQLSECCRLYNAALQERRDAYRKGFKSPTCYDQTAEYTQVRHDGTTDILSYKVGQDVLQRVDRAFDGLDASMLWKRLKPQASAAWARDRAWFRRFNAL